MSSKESFELVITIFGAIFITIATLIYYANPKFSVCNRCGKDISINKKDRYWAKINGQKVAICKSCYNKPFAYGFVSDKAKVKISTEPKLTPSKPVIYEPSKYCYGCTREITRRMKVHKVELLNTEQNLCSNCNRYIARKIKKDAEINELLNDSFLGKNSDVKSAQELISLYRKPIDLESSEWDNHILRHTRFNDWESLKSESLNEINREAIVKAIQFLRDKHKS